MIIVTGTVTTRLVTTVTLELEDDDDLKDLKWRLCASADMHRADCETDASEITISRGE